MSAAHDQAILAIAHLDLMLMTASGSDSIEMKAKVIEFKKWLKEESPIKWKKYVER